VDDKPAAKKAGIERKCSRSQKEKGGGDGECEGNVIRFGLMCVQHQENLHHRRNAATDWCKCSQAERYDECDYYGDVPRGNGSICIDEGIADEHSRSAQAQEEEPPACRASGEHRKQSLHQSMVMTARRRGESQKEVGTISPFEGAPTLGNSRIMSDTRGS
jgi:hypothetical protein